MLSEDLLKKVRRIEITTRKIVEDMMSGDYRSHFKGHGVQFSEHRVYQPGDDVRHIDWKASARSREALIKKFDEERELTVFLVVDVSGSKDFGSENKLKMEVAAEIGGMIGYAATHTGDRVGLLLFASEVEQIIPPKKGRHHILRLIRDLLGHQPRTRGTSLSLALDAAGRMMKHAGVVFIISDFKDKNYERSLKQLSRRHDVVAIWVQDPKESRVPDVGFVELEDPETGASHFVDTGSFGFRNWIEKNATKFSEQTQSLLKSAQVEIVKVQTSEDYGEAVVRFFKSRNRKRTGRARA